MVQIKLHWPIINVLNLPLITSHSASLCNQEQLPLLSLSQRIRQKTEKGRGAPLRGRRRRPRRERPPEKERPRKRPRLELGRTEGWHRARHAHAMGKQQCSAQKQKYWKQRRVYDKGASFHLWHQHWGSPEMRKRDGWKPPYPMITLTGIEVDLSDGSAMSGVNNGKKAGLKRRVRPESISSSLGLLFLPGNTLEQNLDGC